MKSNIKQAHFCWHRNDISHLFSNHVFQPFWNLGVTRRWNILIIYSNSRIIPAKRSMLPHVNFPVIFQTKNNFSLGKPSINRKVLLLMGRKIPEIKKSQDVPLSSQLYQSRIHKHDQCSLILCPDLKFDWRECRLSASPKALWNYNLPIFSVTLLRKVKLVLGQKLSNNNCWVQQRHL